VTGNPITKKQIADMLTVCSHFDGRTLEPETFDAWYLLLGDLPYEDVENAVRTHYRTDRRWIMPADIVAHHEKLDAARAVEHARLHPPACPGCGVTYTTSALPGSRWARPDAPHGAECRVLHGMLSFDDRRLAWGVNPSLDPATFDEAAYEAAMADGAAEWAKRCDAINYGYDTGYHDLDDWPPRLMSPSEIRALAAGE
jgi:hypothetical protein